MNARDAWDTMILQFVRTHIRVRKTYKLVMNMIWMCCNLHLRFCLYLLFVLAVFAIDCDRSLNRFDRSLTDLCRLHTKMNPKFVYHYFPWQVNRASRRQMIYCNNFFSIQLTWTHLAALCFGLSSLFGNVSSLVRKQTDPSPSRSLTKSLKFPHQVPHHVPQGPSACPSRSLISRSLKVPH